MEFRWVAVLTLWTMLSGPILSQPSPPKAAPSSVRASHAKPAKPIKPSPTTPVRG
jgi:hypothetical protein